MPDVYVTAEQVSSGWITLVANEVSTVTFESNVFAVEVRGKGDAAVYFTVDGSTPTIDGRNTYDLMAGVISVDERRTGQANEVKLISAAATEVRVVRA